MSTVNEWSEWIEWSGGKCPIPWARADEYECRWSTIQHGSAFHASGWRWSHGFSNIITAYRYLLSAAPKQDAPWLPPQQDGFGPWVEHAPGTKPSCYGRSLAHVLLRHEREREAFFANAVDQLGEWDWGDDGDSGIVAYALRLEPAQVQGETVQSRSEKITVIERSASIRPFDIFGPGDLDMLRRDDSGTKPTRERPVPVLPSVDPKPLPPDGLLIMAPIGQRVGSGWWGL